MPPTAQITEVWLNYWHNASYGYYYSKMFSNLTEHGAIVRCFMGFHSIKTTITSIYLTYTSKDS